MLGFPWGNDGTKSKKNPTVLSGAGMMYLESENALPAKPLVEKEQERRE
jgi:hypothetical protein